MSSAQLLHHLALGVANGCFKGGWGSGDFVSPVKRWGVLRGTENDVKDEGNAPFQTRKIQRGQLILLGGAAQIL